MGYIKEETKHPDFDAEIVVDEKTKDEVCDEWEIVGLSISSFTVRTPNDLIELGKWLVKNGIRIKHEYTSTGKRTKNKAGNITTCPTCGAEATISWSGLELVETSGDETLATKHYKSVV